MELIDLIPAGHENAVSRKELVRISGLPDRKVRKLIEGYTREGSIVINLEDGYFRYCDDSDVPYLESYYRREMARGWSIINKCRAIRKFLNGSRGQAAAGYRQISLSEYMRDRRV